MNFINYVVAISSAIGFALQMILALVIVRYFSPNVVGELILISQIGFLLASISLAQAHIGLLANKSGSLRGDTMHALFSSLKRFMFFAPICILIVWTSKLPIIGSSLWALLLSITLMTWLIAQSMSLRTSSLLIQSGVRFIPQLFSFFFVIIIVYYEIIGPALLTAALLGYFVGAVWILPVILNKQHSFYRNYAEHKFQEVESYANKDFFDDRSTILRIAHSFGDVVLATAILVVWQRLYGSQETGWLSAPLRILGFVPAVVNIAWSQTSMAQKQASQGNSLIVGAFGFIFVAILGLCCFLLINSGFLDRKWDGVTLYLLPIILWQGSACLVSAYAHTPFQTGRAKEYSHMNMIIIAIQFLSLISPFLVPFYLSQSFHLYFFSSISFFVIFFCFLN